MSDAAFPTLVSDTLGFMARLTKNNSRDWFLDHKGEYENLVKHPAERLLETVGASLRDATGAHVTPKLYRIHRDLRFSKDKTPYNTHLHLQWSTAGPVSFLFGVSAAYVCAGAGAMGFAPAHLAAWRDRVGGRQGDALVDEVETLTASGLRLDPPELKRVPPPEAQDHPRAAYLRRKSLVLWHDLTGAERTAPASALDTVFTKLAPFGRELAALLAPK